MRRVDDIGDIGITGEQRRRFLMQQIEADELTERHPEIGLEDRLFRLTGDIGTIFVEEVVLPVTGYNTAVSVEDYVGVVEEETVGRTVCRFLWITVYSLVVVHRYVHAVFASCAGYALE